jgi:putative oxidoreductase
MSYEIALGLLVARLIIGLGIAVHGAQKVFGWFGGYSPKDTARLFFEPLGFRPGIFFVYSAGLGELGGGILTATGFLGALGPALIIMVMLVAAIAVHAKKGFFASNGGWELCGTYIAGALAFAFGGFGAYSIDNAIGSYQLSGGRVAWVLVLAAVVLAFANLLVRRPAQEASTGA